MHFADIAHAQETTTTDQPANSGLLASLGINGTLFTFQLINFAVVAAVLWFLILKPLTKKMSERQKLIDDSIDNAKKIQDTLQKSEQKYQERVDGAKVEANKILEKAQQETEQLTETMRGKAKKEIELLIQQAKRNIQLDREEMSAELKQQTADLIVLALEKILAEKIDSTKDKEMIVDTLKKLKG